MLQSNFSIRGRGSHTRALLLVFVLAISFVLSACVRSESDPAGAASVATNPTTTTPPDDTVPPPVDPDPPTSTPPASDKAAFEQFLYPVLVDTNNFCVTCHAASVIPNFAASDTDTAYNHVVSQAKVDLDNPDLSRLYLRPAVDRHNCGGDAVCDRIAGDVLDGITAWAANRPPPDPTMTRLMSATTSFAAGATAGLTRADGNLIALFTFDEGAGDVTVDSSGVGAPITLELTGMEWVEGGGLRNISGRALASADDSRKLFEMITPVNAYTIEAWIIPDNDMQDGPARIVSYSQDTSVRNFTLGQNAIYYQLRNRSSQTNANGTPALEALEPQVATSLTHVVSTYDSSGRRIYVNGELSIEENLDNITLEWLDDQRLVLGNEVADDRLWQGVLNMVAIHNKALSASEVLQNFNAGAGNVITLRFDLADILNAPSYIEMQAEQLDPFAYVFATPVYAGDVTGVQIKNIRVGVNGNVPVAAQTFRRIDTTALQSGVELSPLGAVIPAVDGPDSDVFHLEFEVLGGQFGLSEPIAPSSPPAPAPDTPEPDFGMRTFSQVNDTMEVLTGISAKDSAVSTRYSQLRDSLPATADLLAFATAQQIAIQQLATTYCGEIVADDGTCANFFGLGSCDVGANDKGTVADNLYDRLIGANLAGQPARAGVATEIVSTLDGQGCVNGCNGAAAETALNVACAAVLSSGAVTIN